MSFDYQRTWSEWDPWNGIPEQYNLGVALTQGQVEAGRGDRPALLWENAAGATRTFTYHQLDAATNRLAAALSQLGIVRGDRVLLRLPNLPEFYIAALAVAKLGGVFVPSSIQLRTSEVGYRLRDSGAVAAITTTELAEPIEEASGSCPNLKHVIVAPYPDPRSSTGKHLDWNRLMDEAPASFDPAPTRNDDLAFIAYTSGTTGDPKGVAHFQRYPLSYESLLRFWHDYRDDDVVACPSELGWLLPLTSAFLYPLGRGLTVVQYDSLGGKFDAVKWFELIAKYRITNFTAPPTSYRMLMANADAAARFELSSLRHAVSAGEPLPADTLRAIQKHFGVMPLDGIGMSECMVYCFNMAGQPMRPGSCGRPGPGTVIELMDDDLNPVPDGQDGVLCVRSDSHPGMMKQYWNKPEQTAEIFRGEWYISGDELRRDADGWFWFQGRNDDVINASGHRISPFEVESCLVSHPAVLEAAAIESPDPVRGGVVKAFLVLRSGFEPSDSLATEIREYVKQAAAPYKCPRKVAFVESLPKTTSGKIKRRELRESERAAD